MTNSEIKDKKTENVSNNQSRQKNESGLKNNEISNESN